MSIDNSVINNNRSLLDSSNSEINQNDVQYMNNANTLINRMDSGGLLDVATAASLFLPEGPESLPPPDQYPPEEILSAQDLTEEDRKLAAALVAVQLVQQQKQQQQQQLLLNDAGISSVNSHNSSEVLPEIVNLDKMTLGRSIPNTQSLVLPSIEKSVSTNYINNTGSHISNQQLNINNEPNLFSQTTPKRSNQWAINKNKTNVKKGANKLQLSTKSPLRFAALSSICSPFSESLDNIKIEEGLNEVDDAESDYDVKTETRPAKKSLPHKKRISRKLRHNPKHVNSLSKCNSCGDNVTIVYKCNSCGEQFSNQSEYSAHKATHTGNSSANKLGNVPFACQLCPQRFDSQLLFFEHLKGHYEPLVQLTEFQKSRIQIQNIKSSGEKESTLMTSPFKCTKCGRTFKRQKTFEAHIRDVHPNLDLEEFSEPEDLMEGIRFKVVVDSEDCDNDNDVLSNHPIGSESETQSLDVKHSSSNQLLTSSHIEIHNYSKMWYREDELHATEADLRELEAQQFKEEQINSSVHTCHLCGAMFETKSFLTQHLTQCYLALKQEADFLNSSTNDIQPTTASQNVHFNEDEDDDDDDDPKSKKNQKKNTQLVCTICGRIFNHRNSLVYHLRSHSGERPHKCEHCEKSFFASSALKVHLRLHSGAKPFKCEFCGRHFRQWGDLKYHTISIHSDQRQYQCEYCGKDFARKYSLIVHRRIHTGEKNYQCEYCNKTFRASSYLQNHRKIHTGEKPHPCDICGKPFRVRSDMKRHMNTHNRDRTQKPDPIQTDMQDNNSKSEITINEFSDINQLSVESNSTELNKVEVNMKTEAQDVLQTPKEEDNGPLYAIQSDPLAIREGNNTLYVWPVYMN